MRLVIVGGGVAGIVAAQQLRALAPAASVTVLSAEPHLYYLRPGLIDVLAGRKSLGAITPYSEGWYRDRQIDLRRSAEVTELDPHGQRVILSTGEGIRYDRLLLATGADASCPPIPGADATKLYTIRTADDVYQITQAAQEASHAAVLGGGWLGLEVARALREQGLDVAVLEREGRLLPRQLDEQGSEVLSAVLGALGVAIRTGIERTEVVGPGSVRITCNGEQETLAAQLIVVAAGIRCRTTLARRAGLEVGRGVIVDDLMGTSREGIYAAGDAAEWRGHTYGIIPAAREQAQVAARNMVQCGSSQYSGTPVQQTLKVVGVDLAVLGDPQPAGGEGRELRYADRELGVYRKLVLDENDRLIGAVVLGDQAVGRTLKAALLSGQSIGGQTQHLLKGQAGF